MSGCFSVSTRSGGCFSVSSTLSCHDIVEDGSIDVPNIPDFGCDGIELYDTGIVTPNYMACCASMNGFIYYAYNPETDVFAFKKARYETGDAYDLDSVGQGDDGYCISGNPLLHINDGAIVAPLDNGGCFDDTGIYGVYTPFERIAPVSRSSVHDNDVVIEKVGEVLKYGNSCYQLGFWPDGTFDDDGFANKYIRLFEISSTGFYTYKVTYKDLYYGRRDNCPYDSYTIMPGGTVVMSGSHELARFDMFTGGFLKKRVIDNGVTIDGIVGHFRGFAVAYDANNIFFIDPKTLQIVLTCAHNHAGPFRAEYNTLCVCDSSLSYLPMVGFENKVYLLRLKS